MVLVLLLERWLVVKVEGDGLVELGVWGLLCEFWLHVVE